MALEKEEFDLLFRRVYPNLCRFLESLIGDHAPDIAQECFMKLFRQGSDGLDADGARYWLFRVGRNLALNEIRNRSRRLGFFEQIRSAFYSPRPTQAEDYERGVRRKLVTEMLQDLPEHQRTVLLLREHEEMSYAEIAQTLEIAESKVKVDIFRARTALRKRVEGTMPIARVS